MESKEAIIAKSLFELLDRESENNGKLTYASIVTTIRSMIAFEPAAEEATEETKGADAGDGAAATEEGAEAEAEAEAAGLTPEQVLAAK